MGTLFALNVGVSIALHILKREVDSISWSWGTLQPWAELWLPLFSIRLFYRQSRKSRFARSLCYITTFFSRIVVIVLATCFRLSSKSFLSGNLCRPICLRSLALLWVQSPHIVLHCDRFFLGALARCFLDGSVPPASSFMDARMPSGRSAATMPSFSLKNLSMASACSASNYTSLTIYKI